MFLNMGWYINLFLLLCILLKTWSTVNASKLIEHTRDSFLRSMQSRKTSFIYFGDQVNPTVMLFLEQLEKSADALEDYGILVAKVNCSETFIPKYCTGEKVMKKAYLFRGSEVLKSFGTDTVFDVTAIVAHVLFTVLFNEVRNVKTPEELLNVEKALKGKADIVLAHVVLLGTPEHRAVMEAAFVYGAKHQFVLTTGGSVLKYIGVQDPSSSQSGLWFLHCKEMLVQSSPCHRTVLRRPLTTLNIYTFLQLIEAPLVTEASVDPSDFRMVHSHAPVLFIFSQVDTLSHDRVTAETIGKRLRGEVGLVLIHRDSKDMKTPLEYNAAYRLPGETSTVKYFTLKSVEEVVKLFSENTVEEKEEEEEEFEDFTVLDVFDDEVMENVYQYRDLELDTGLVSELTTDTFSRVVDETKVVMVLFFFRWDPVSMDVMQSFKEAADTIQGIVDVHLTCVDCAEWTDLCSRESISAFPIIRMYSSGKSPQIYTGMLGTENLLKYILLAENNDLQLADMALPRGFDTTRQAHSHQVYSTKTLVSDIKRVMLETFPELMVENLPLFLELRKPLLLLFLEGNEKEDGEEEEGGVKNRDIRGELSSLIGTPQLDTYTFCWIHLGRTPVGRAVLKSYLGSVPPLPALVLTQLGSGAELYHFPSESPLLSQSVLQWLQRVEDKEEQPAGLILDKKWGPPVPLYNFLSVMDQQLPGYADQRAPVSKTWVEAEAVNEDQQGQTERSTHNHKKQNSKNFVSHHERDEL